MKNAVALLVRYLLACLLFVAITIVSAGYSRIDNYLFCYPAAGLIFLALLFFMKSEKKGTLFIIPFMSAVFAIIIYFIMLFTPAAGDHYLFSDINQLLVLVISLRALRPDAFLNEGKPLTIKDVLACTVFSAVISGVVVGIYEEYLFGGIIMVTILGHLTALIALFAIYVLPWIFKGLKWMFMFKTSKV